MISIEADEKPDSNWNLRLLNSPHGTIYQTKEIAAYLETVLRSKNIFLKFVNERGKIVGQLLLSTYSRFDKKGKVGRILKKIPGQKNLIYRWSYGPVIFDSSVNNEVCAALHDFLILRNCRVLGYEHPLAGGSLSVLGKPFKIRPWATFLIDLSLNKEILWKNMDKHAARKNIERSRSRGVYVKEIDQSNLALYHKMLQGTKEKVGVDLELSYTQILWDKLHSIGFTGFLAFENEMPVGGIAVSTFNNYVNEWGVARSERDTMAKLYSQDLLKWKIIEWAVDKKFLYYDLSGTNPDSKDEKEKGIFQYKKKWGGNLIKYNMITM